MQKRTRTDQGNALFSILIPSWNNLVYLQHCVQSIRDHSSFDHQIIVVVNEGTDGTKEWVQAQIDLDSVISEKNLGICYALNSARNIVKAKYILYSNDDMYYTPDWDAALWREVEAIGHQMFMLSSTMIEPRDTNNPCVVVRDFGEDLESFDRDGLLKEYRSLYREDWLGSTWPPNLLPVDLWDLVGGMSIEFSPGMYSDPDLSMKLWKAGVRDFKGVGDSLVYHFGTKTTRRLRKPAGKDIFLLKWGMSSRTFTNELLLRGQDMKKLPEVAHRKTGLFDKIKMILAVLRKR